MAPHFVSIGLGLLLNWALGAVEFGGAFARTTVNQVCCVYIGMIVTFIVTSVVLGAMID